VGDLRGHFWPSDDERLLLRAALLAGPDAERAWRVLRPRFDIETLSPEQHRILPLLWRNLARVGIEDPIAPRLKGVYRNTWVRNQLLFHDMAIVLEAFRAADVPTLVLKGGALISTCYRDPGLRQMVDFDVLVPPVQAAAAMHVLAETGWRHLPVTRSALGWLTRIPHIGPREDELDLHWDILRRFVEPGGAESRTSTFWERSVPIEVAGASTRALAPADQLLHACVHGARWDSSAQLRWIADATTIVAAHPDLDWDRVGHQAVEVHAALLLKDALAYLAREFDVPIPIPLLASLQRTKTSWKEGLAHRLNGWDAPVVFRPLSRIVAGYADVSIDWRSSQFVTRFPGYLQALWNLERTWDIPAAAVHKGATRVRSAARTFPRGA
jgi:hypothetical protein